MVSKRKILIIGLIIAVLIIIFLSVIILYVDNLISTLKPVYVENGTISTNISLFKSGIADYNYSGELSAYAYLNYTIKNATDAKMLLLVYQKNPIMKIYLVNPLNSCYDCFNTGALEANLSTDLSNYGLIFNSSSFQVVNIFNTSTISPDSIVILPTGLLPAEILPYTGFSSGAEIKNMIQLLNESDTIIYVGQNSTRLIENGQILIANNYTSSALNNEGFQTNSFSKKINTPGYLFNLPTFMLSNGTSIGSISYINFGNNTRNGTVVAFSNYPKVGWQTSGNLASDISTAIYQRFWLKQLAYGSTNISQAPSPNSLSGRTLIFTLKKDIPFNSGAALNINSSFKLLLINSSNGYKYQNLEYPLHITYNNSADLSLPPVLGYGDQVPIGVSINQLSTNKAFSVISYNKTFKSVYSFPLNFFNTTYSIVKYGSFDVPTGQYYIGYLVDINNVSHGSVLFYVPYLNVTTLYSNFKNGTFIFNISSNNQELSDIPYSININGQYQTQGMLKNGTINYTLPKGTTLNYGYQYLNLSLININYVIPEYYQSPPGIPSIYIEFGIAAFLILIMNIVLRPPNSEDYYIDIPEMPPIKKERVTVKSDKIISLFDSVNFKYKWKYMPLTPEEIKLSISSSIRENNMPISITLQNTKKILNQLNIEGKLSTTSEYYMPYEWSKSSSHDIEYLVIFRKLRDLFVSHAIPFTDLDLAPEADMVATLRDKNINLYIFSSISGVRKINIKSNNNIIVFLDRETRLSFKDKLNNTYTKDMNDIRLVIYSNYVRLADIENPDLILS